MEYSKKPAENALFTLCYLLIATDGNVHENEKNLFLDVLTKSGGFTRSYAECVFNTMHKFSKTFQYNQAIENIKPAPVEFKDKTIDLLASNFRLPTKIITETRWPSYSEYKRI